MPPAYRAWRAFAGSDKCTHLVPRTLNFKNGQMGMPKLSWHLRFDLLQGILVQSSPR